MKILLIIYTGSALLGPFQINAYTHKTSTHHLLCKPEKFSLQYLWCTQVPGVCQHKEHTLFTNVGEVYIDQGLWSSEGAPSSCQLSEALHMFFQDLYVKQASDNTWPQHTNEQGKQQILPILLRSTQNTDVQPTISDVDCFSDFFACLLHLSCRQLQQHWKFGWEMRSHNLSGMFDLLTAEQKELSQLLFESGVRSGISLSCITICCFHDCFFVFASSIPYFTGSGQNEGEETPITPVCRCVTGNCVFRFISDQPFRL